jgi:iron complex outermembrane receptor protein
LAWKIQTGFANGIFDYENPTPNNQPGYVKPTKLLSYTVGVKNRFLNGRLEVNDEAFYYDYTNYLVQTIIIASDGTNTNGFYTVPKATDYGDQLDLRALVTNDLSLQVNVAYLHARTGSFTTTPGVSYSNYTLFDSPEWTASLGAQYRWPLSTGADITARINAYYSSGYWGDFPQEDGTLQEAFTRTDLSFTYHEPNGRWSLGLYGKNLENQAQMAIGASVEAGVTKGLDYVTAPRTFGVRFTLSVSRPSK